MHVDEFIDSGSGNAIGQRDENYARWVLNHFRLPAALKMDFDEFMQNNKLFCEYKGRKYRVTGASRLGDIWLHSNFKKTFGYTERVNISLCTNWSKK